MAICKYGISFLLVGAIVFIYRDKLDEVVDLLRGANVPLLIATFMGSICLVFMFAWRLKLILRAQSVNVSIFNAFVVAMAGYFFNNFVPSAMGADLFKGVYLSHGSNKVKEVFSSILVDRVIGLITLIMIAFGAMLSHQELFADKNVSRMILLMTVAALGVCLFFMSKSLARFLKPLLQLLPHKRGIDILRNFYDAIHGYKQHPLVVLQAVVISIVVQVLFFTSIYLLATAIHLNVALNLFLVFIPLVSLAAIAPSLNGLGVRDVMFVYFFGKYCSEEGALAIAVLIDALFISLGLVGGVVFALAGKMDLKALDKASATDQT